MSSSNEKNIEQEEGLEIIWKSLLAYGVWFVIRTAFTKLNFLSGTWNLINDALAKIYVSLSGKTLEFLGHPANYNARNILMAENQEMYVGNHCLGISAMVIFLLIILLLKGPRKHKLWFSIFGLTLIFLANWFRIVGLAFMLSMGSEAFFQFNHKYTYLVMVYSLIFFLIIWFQKKISKF